nr:hypothetical protein [Saprospiraceae bacterium]
DEIYDKLVKVRTRIAKKLGYDNFVSLGYNRMRRTEYGPEQAAKFREHVLNYVVPLSLKIKENQKKKISKLLVFFKGTTEYGFEMIRKIPLK